MPFSLFKRKKSGRPEESGWPIRQIVRETPEAITIVFEKTAAEVPYRSGQFLTVVARPGGREARRAYSLCSSPYADERLAVCVKRIGGGLVSNFLNDSLAAGQRLEVLAPDGRFVYSPAEPARQLVLFAAGSGITPLMSMAKSALHGSETECVRLLYSNKTEESIIFREELDGLREKFGARLLVTHTLTEPGEGWKGARGRIDAEKVAAFCRGLDASRPASYYLCGPEGLMDTVAACLRASGVREADVFREKFAAAPRTAGPEARGEKARTVTVVLDGKERRVRVAPGQTILEAALKADLDVPFSCQSGLCTACCGRRLSGELEMEDTGGLTDEERAKGRVLLCVSKPKSDGVAVAVGKKD